MIKRRKTVSDIRNPLLRKTLVIAILLSILIYLPGAVVCLAIMEGVPGAWNAVRKIGRTGEIDAIKRAWIGSKHSRMNETSGATELKR